MHCLYTHMRNTKRKIKCLIKKNWYQFAVLIWINSTWCFKNGISSEHIYLILKSKFYVPISFKITPLIGTLNETYQSFYLGQTVNITVMALKTIILLKQNPNSTAALLIWLLAFFMLGILYFLSRRITWRIKATHNSLYYNSSSASGKKSRTRRRSEALRHSLVFFAGLVIGGSLLENRLPKETLPFALKSFVLVVVHTSAFVVVMLVHK